MIGSTLFILSYISFCVPVLLHIYIILCGSMNFKDEQRGTRHDIFRNGSVLFRLTITAGCRTGVPGMEKISQLTMTKRLRNSMQSASSGKSRNDGKEIPAVLKL